MSDLIHSLRFQIAAALLVLVALFGVSSFYALKVLEEQLDNDAVLRLAGQLQLTTQHMAMHAMNYKDNAPRDYPTYFRDINLYYQDLQDSSNRVDAITSAFAGGHFPAALTGLDRDLSVRLAPGVLEHARALQEYWADLKSRIRDKLGPDESEPRLEWAAEELVRSEPDFRVHTDALVGALNARMKSRTRAAHLFNRIIMVGAMLISAGILFWFYRRVVKPLDHSVKAFRRVADGDFGFRVEVDARNEIGQLTESFNHLSGRLHWLLGLIARLQQGSDLDATLRFVADSFPKLIPLDWVGILFVTDDGQIQLERAYADGEPESLGMIRFPFSGTPLEECLRDDQPLHIPDIPELTTFNPGFKFLRFLDVRHRRDAIFLPVTGQSPIPGVLVFATRQAHAYRSEHRTLLANLSVLITLSFGRTLKLAEHARLAAIGQFASGIAHEIRNPLATIDLALSYFRNASLPEPVVKRADLAHSEARRMGRLLEDMLLYAKPLHLKTGDVGLFELMNELAGMTEEYAAQSGVTVQFDDVRALPPVQGDRDRLIQVLLNLVRNAIEASPSGSQVSITTTHEADAGCIAISISNRGKAIPDDNLHRIYEPFFTTKASGTGLGLAIVRRIAEAHGGTISAKSNETEGTRFTLRLPLPTDEEPVIADDRPPEAAA